MPTCLSVFTVFLGKEFFCVGKKQPNLFYKWKKFGTKLPLRSLHFVHSGVYFVSYHSCANDQAVLLAAS